MSGTLYGVGVGPGDPQLVTLKAAERLAQARTVAYFAKRGKPGNAFTTARALLHPEAELIPLEYPYTVELSPRDPVYIDALRAFYDQAAEQLGARLTAGFDVSVLCEGDPLFYGSYMYLHDRLAAQHRTQVIPGITSFAGCAASGGIALVSTDRVFSVVPGTLPEPELEQRLCGEDAVVILKLGSNFGKVRRVLERVGRLHDATYFEHGTTERQVVLPLAQKADERALYFSLIIVPAHHGGSYRAPEVIA